MKIKYYYLAMTQKSMLRNQVLEELLRERAHNYLSKKKSLDFWLLIAPNYINNKNFEQKIYHTNFFFQNSSQLRSSDGSFFCCSLISLDIDFIRWVKLRLGFFETALFQKKEKEHTYVSDGIIGEIFIDSEEGLSPLDNNKNMLSTILETQKAQNIYRYR